MPTELEHSTSSWAVTKKCSFIEPGVVNYADVGMVLVRKEVLDKMANSFIGKPVVNEEHRSVDPSDYKEGNADGIINAVWFDSDSAKFHCQYQVWDANTLKNISGGYKVSCAYNVTRWGPGGIHNNVPYDKEVLDGEYTHLAIVNNPRYEDVRIYNKGGSMKLTWLQRLMKDGKELTNSHEIETANSKVEINGKQVGLDECLNAYKEQQDKLENAGPSDDDVINLGNGKTATVKELKAAYAAKNADDEEKKKKEKDEEENAEDEEKKKKDEKEKENKMKNDMDKDHEDGKHDDKEMKSCAMCNAIEKEKGRNHFEVIKSLANKRDNDKKELENIGEFHDGFAEGMRLFGSEKKSA